MSDQEREQPDPEDEFRSNPQFYEAFKDAFFGVLIVALCLIAYFGWGAWH